MSKPPNVPHDKFITKFSKPMAYPPTWWISVCTGSYNSSESDSYIWKVLQKGQLLASWKKTQKSLLQKFKESFEERKKENHSFSQGSCAAEIRSISGHTCHLNQSVVSKMLKGQYMPKEGEKTVRYCVMNEKWKKHIQKTGEDPIETVILDDNESTDNDK